MCVIDFNGKVAHKVISGSYNSTLFGEFIDLYLAPYFRLYPQKILILDNVRFHKSPEILGKLIRYKIRHHFLPAYTPQLNAIEEFFSMLKSRYHAVRSNFNSINDTIESILDDGFSIECANFYRHMVSWFEKASQREDFI
jgi:transposase